jgi:hypothetical protein
MEIKYFVDWVSHNSDTQGWNFKQTKMFDDLSAAKKEFHNVLGTYIAYGKLDLLTAVLYDSYGRMIMSECWDVRVAPEPPEPSI